MLGAEHRSLGNYASLLSASEYLYTAPACLQMTVVLTVGGA